MGEHGTSVTQLSKNQLQAQSQPPFAQDRTNEDGSTWTRLKVKLPDEILPLQPTIKQGNMWPWYALELTADSTEALED